MRIAIAGGHGRVALLLGQQLVADGHDVTGLVRNPDHFADLVAVGMDPVLCDIEVVRTADVAVALEGHDAAVFAAGAGPGSGAARKETVDFAGAVKFTDACARADVLRLVMLSSMGTDAPPMDTDTESVYLRAKARADDHLMASRLDWTVVRPGRLTNDQPSGAVDIARHVEGGEIPRADIAAVIAHVLRDPGTIWTVFEVVAGATAIATALADWDVAAA